MRRLLDSPQVRSWAGRLAKTVAGQGLVQALSVIIGFLLIRWLSVEQYAQFGVVFGFQITLAMFVDLGFSGCIVALVGARGHDPAVLGRYVATARSLRWWSMLVAVPIAALAFHWIGQRQGWAPGTHSILFGLVVAAVFFDGISTYSGAALLIHQRLGTYYRAPAEAAAGRLFACLALRLSAALSVVSLCLVNVLGSAWNAWRLRREAQRHLDPAARADAATRREMLGYLAPLVPGLIFTAFQGQILLFLSSIFAGTQQIAEMTALGRLSQLFILLSALNGSLIAPHFAKLPAALVARRYLIVLGLACTGGALLAGLAFVYPDPLIWLLGPSYEHLRGEIGWTMLGAVTAFVGNVMWAMNSARKWIFWWSTGFYIASVTVGQAVFLYCWGASTTRHLLLLAIGTNVLIHLVHGSTAWVGLRLERNAAARSPAS